MGFAKTEAEIAERLARFVKAELKRADVTYEVLAETERARAGRDPQFDRSKTKARELPGDLPDSGDGSNRTGER